MTLQKPNSQNVESARAACEPLSLVLARFQQHTGPLLYWLLCPASCNQECAELPQHPALLPQHHNRGHKGAGIHVRMTGASHSTKASATLMGTARPVGKWPKTACKMDRQGCKWKKRAIHLLFEHQTWQHITFPGQGSTGNQVY